MAPHVAERLSALARDHAEGRMTLEAYRRLRGLLLDGLVGITDESAADTTQPRARVAQSLEPLPSEPLPPDRLLQDETSPERRPAAEARPAPEPRMRREPSPLHGPGWSELLSTPTGRARLAGLAGAVILIATFVIWYGTSRTHPSSPVASTTGSASGATVDPLQALLQPLIDNPDWSDARLSAVNDALVAAGRARLAAAHNADWFNAFVDQVRGRVKERQALAGAPLSPDRSPLAALAVTLGIDLTAPDRPTRMGEESASDSHGIEPDSRERETLRGGNHGP